jgi:hypothetical protein
MFRSLANVVLLTSSIVCAGVALSSFGFIAWLLLGSGQLGGLVEDGGEGQAYAFTFALVMGMSWGLPPLSARHYRHWACGCRRDHTAGPKVEGSVECGSGFH